MFQAHVVKAFEQSLTNMTSRLQTLTSSAEAKVRHIDAINRADEIDSLLVCHRKLHLYILPANVKHQYYAVNMKMHPLLI